MDAKPKRRLFRYSLRTLLIVVTVGSAGFGWLGVKMRQAKTQREAVAALPDVCSVVYDYELDSNGSFVSDAKPPGPGWVRQLFGVDMLATPTKVFCMGHLMTDADLRHVEVFRELKMLELMNPRITNEGLAHLRGLVELEEVCLFGADISDAGLAHLEGLSKLRDLNLNGVRVTDAGLVHLQKLVSLENLCLTDTQVTDEGLACLQNLPRLKELYLAGTRVPTQDWSIWLDLIDSYR